MTLLEFCKAVAEGKALQFKNPGNAAEEWVDAQPDQLQYLSIVLPEKWRLKPTTMFGEWVDNPPGFKTKFRPWTYEEVPVGATVRSELDFARAVIMSAEVSQTKVDPETKKHIVFINLGNRINRTPAELLQAGYQFLWTDGSGKTSWLPCGAIDYTVLSH